MWLRGVITDNYEGKNNVFVINFGDYGFEMICIKSDIRPLHRQYTTKYLPFQKINFFLTDVDHKPEVKREDVIKEVKSLMSEKDFIISVSVESEDKRGSIYGLVLLEEDCDLAAILLEKQLVDDVHYCHRAIRKMSEVLIEKGESKGWNRAGPFRSPIKAYRYKHTLQSCLQMPTNYQI